LGVNLTPIVVKRHIELDDLRDRVVAIDGNGELYQFLALIRLADGTPLRDSHGRVTSHLSGLFYRTTRLIAEHGIRPVFVFDGKPPERKTVELERRRAIRARYERESEAARRAGDLARAYSKATMTSRLTRTMVDEAQELVGLMGLTAISAPSEAEAQGAHMAAQGRVWAAVSKDYDSLLFGANRLVRFLTLSGKEFLPSKGTFRAITPELIELEAMLRELAITREQLVDLAILVGTDFNEGVKGIGPKKALKLVRDHGVIEQMPAEVREAIAPTFEETRRIFLAPDVTDAYDIGFAPSDTDGILKFLCDEREFSRERVSAALERAFGSAGGRNETRDLG
jgi:flap endonuclease-1